MNVEAFSSAASVIAVQSCRSVSVVFAPTRTTRASRPVATPPPAVISTVAGAPGDTTSVYPTPASAMPVPDTPSVGASYTDKREAS